MPIPTIVFGVLLSTFWGAAYHLFRGGPAKKIVFYLILSWAGFWLGDALAYNTGWSFLPVGLLNAGMGSLFSLIFLVVGEMLSNLMAPNKDE